jgi:hypothetical protein
LTLILFLLKFLKYLGAQLSLIGNLVKIGDGPAAVTGDETHKKATVPINRDGKAWGVG